jgi:RecA-family ATPase
MAEGQAPDVNGVPTPPLSGGNPPPVSPHQRLTYSPALTGEALTQAIEAANLVRPTLIEGLMYERSVLLLSADAGTGKSTLVANVMAQASVGLPVFQAFHVPRPLKCYYIPFERGAEEILERLKHMQTVIPYNPDNLLIFNNPSFFPNLYNPHDQDFLLTSIDKDCRGKAPDVVWYDPIYQAVAGGLCNEDRVSIFIRFNVRLMAEFGCATWLNHHTGKPGYTPDGVKIEKEDPYYGSSFLKNHCIGSYYVKETEAKDGTIWLCKKDNLHLLQKKVVLTYNAESYTSFMKDGIGNLPASDRLKIALRQFKRDNKDFTFKQLEGCVAGVSESRIRVLLNTPPFNGVLKKSKSLGDATLYTVEGEI